MDVVAKLAAVRIQKTIEEIFNNDIISVGLVGFSKPDESDNYQIGRASCRERV